MARRGTPDVERRLEALGAAVDLARGRLDDHAVADAERVAGVARERLDLGPRHVVAALAGGTGSGKSSLFNALTGSELAAVGVRRPQTDAPAAWVGGARGAGDLLDWLAVTTRHHAGEAGDLDGLVLLDLPDHDSVALDHQRHTDRLVERVDVLVWVTDPLKYAQRALHDGYLARLTSHASVLLVVLNRIDELAADELAAAAADLRRLLDDEGLSAAQLWCTSTVTGAGVAELRGHLARLVAQRRAIADRIAADIEDVSGALLASCGEPGGGAPPDRRLADQLARAAGVPGHVGASAEAYRRRALLESRSAFARMLRRGLGRVLTLPRALPSGQVPAALPAGAAPAVEQAVLGAVDETAAGLPHPWPLLVHGRGRAVARDAPAALQAALRDVQTETRSRRPRWWGLLAGLRTLVGLVILTGAVWLAVLAGLAYLQLPAPEPPQLGRLPWPTALVLGGALVALLLALLARGLARLGARRRARAVRRTLRRAVTDVAEQRVLEPLLAERRAHDELVDALERARAG